MAVKKKKEFDVMAVVMAAGGGVASGIVQTLLEDNVQFIQDNPKATPAIMAVLSAAGLYFVPDEYDPLFYGMIGASMGDLGEELIAGFGNKSADVKQLSDNAGMVLDTPDSAQNLESPGFEMSNVLDMYEQYS